MQFSIRAVFLCLILPAPHASAQMMKGFNTYPGSMNIKSGAYSLTVARTNASCAIIPHAPYSATQISDRTQTLADGTKVSNSRLQENRMYRDFAGRTRIEWSISIPTAVFGPVKNPPVLAEIFDAVTHSLYFVDTFNKIAHRYANVSTIQVDRKLESAARRISPPAVVSNVDPVRQMESTTESLGTSVIEGILVEGRRTTTTVFSSETGGSRPGKTISESYYSPELMLTVLTKGISESAGTENIGALIDISRAEPDASLFQIPPDYKIIEETGPFELVLIIPKP